MKIWHKAREVNVLVYNMTASFPKEETYGLTSQMRRAAVSIVSNISEGSAFESDAQVLKYFIYLFGLFMRSGGSILFSFRCKIYKG